MSIGFATAIYISTLYYLWVLARPVVSLIPEPLITIELSLRDTQQSVSQKT
jgi:hypothetical protein